MVGHLEELVGLTKCEMYDLPAEDYVPRLYLFLDRHMPDGKRSATAEFLLGVRVSWEAVLSTCRESQAAKGNRIAGAVLAFHRPGDAETIELHAITETGSTHRRAVGVFRDSRGHICPTDALAASSDDGDAGHPDMKYLAEAFDEVPAMMQRT